jgi:hypothetical protein
MNNRATLAALDQCLRIAAPSNVEEIRTPACRYEVDWDVFISIANKYLVAPAVWTALVRVSPFREVPEDVRNYLALLHNRNTHRNASIRAQCLEIGSILAKSGLKAVLIKGAAWLFDGSSAPASDRMMRDIDLLVQSDQVESAVTSLVALGYVDSGDTLVETGHFHHSPLLPKRGEAVVEIHRDLAHRVGLLPSHEVVASAVEVAPGLLLPTLQHRLTHNIIHAQIENGDFVGGLIDIHNTLDLARLVWRAAEIDWHRLATEARTRGIFRQVSGALHASNSVLQSPLPKAVQSVSGRVHAWRCARQREWPMLSKIPEAYGLICRALAWERDAYPLGLGDSRSLKAHVLVNTRRIHRARDFFGSIKLRRNVKP